MGCVYFETVLNKADAWRHQVSFFESLVKLDQGLNPRFPDHWRTL